jgi:3-oxoacyl-[acyl-carrier protein] reductase
MSEFNDKVVLITGGTRGIGRACALAFAKAGAKVAICGRSEDSSQRAAEELSNESKGTVSGFQADMGDSESVDALIKSITDSFGAVEILVNNAGITRDGLIMRMKNEHWSDVFATNMDGAFYASRAVTRNMMKARWGRIINISSVVGIHGQAGQTNYSAAKAGIIGFSKALAQELGPRNVTVNVVAPGYIETDMTADLGEEALAKIVERIPAGRSGTPDDIAASVLFLAGESSSYITGQVLSVDGGMGM